MKKYLIISSIAAFITLIISSILLLINFKDFNWNSAFTFQNQEEKIIHEYQSDYTIDINLESASLEIIPSNDDALYIYSHYNQDKNIFHIKETKQQLSISQKKSTQPEFSFLNFSSEARGKIILQLPEKMKSTITIRGTNGDVSIYDIHGTKLTASTTNGAYDTNSVTFTEQITLNSTNGVVDATGLKSKKVSIKTSNGVVECTDVKAEQVDIQSTNGILDTLDIYAKQVSMKTTNGTISLINEKEPNFVIDTLETSAKLGEVDIRAKYKERIEN